MPPISAKSCHSVELSHLAMRDQLAIVVNLSVVAGVHGAAFVWVLVTGPGSTIIEVHPPREHPLVYFDRCL